MDYTILEFLDTRTNGRTDGWTDRRGSQNSYLDILAVAASICSSALPYPAPNWWWRAYWQQRYSGLAQELS